MRPATPQPRSVTACLALLAAACLLPACHTPTPDTPGSISTM